MRRGRIRDPTLWAVFPGCDTLSCSSPGCSEFIDTRKALPKLLCDVDRSKRDLVENPTVDTAATGDTEKTGLSLRGTVPKMVEHIVWPSRIDPVPLVHVENSNNANVYLPASFAAIISGS